MPLTQETFALFALAIVSLVLLAGVGTRLTALQTRVAALSRVEAKLDLLLSQTNIKFDPYANLPAGIAVALQSGQKIKAIKIYRQSSGVGLKEAKDFIEEVQRRSGMA
jgi:ribosomal protein L7/L12